MNSISITSGNQVQFNEGIANTDHDISLFRKAFASRCCHTCASVEPEGGHFIGAQGVSLSTVTQIVREVTGIFIEPYAKY
jgi:hypothetical protein